MSSQPPSAASSLASQTAPQPVSQLIGGRSMKEAIRRSSRKTVSPSQATSATTAGPSSSSQTRGRASVASVRTSARITSPTVRSPLSHPETPIKHENDGENEGARQRRNVPPRPSGANGSARRPPAYLCVLRDLRASYRRCRHRHIASHIFCSRLLDTGAGVRSSCANSCTRNSSSIQRNCCICSSTTPCLASTMARRS